MHLIQSFKNDFCFAFVFNVSGYFYKQLLLQNDSNQLFFGLQAAVDDVIGQVNTQISDIKEKVMGVIPMKNKDAMKKEE